ncbi:Crp/Fnr family transcriptional regulator [Fulvivirga ligni]|uniref:Crp/Fnr family transcriptional regulator n=1 Tax=Fulvivirga ligni TaxID=2904246 RepID=UPI001F318282|nr:Crp/Fnr family transcriptional regulator [Fulvivirga ligni]UII21542.1 Crp/Fnr family transcriptional regulator [Fulvivirga ligni]
MDKLIQFLSAYGELAPEDISLIKREVKEVSAPKGTRLASATEFLQEIYFLERGITRVFYFTDKGDEVTKYFIDEEHFSSDGHSFLHQLPLTSYVETVTDCDLIKISRESFDLFTEQIAGWSEIYLKILNQGLHDKINRISPMMAETATERYEKFMQRFPHLLNQIPLNLLASYLGITKSSLSRIRKNIV